LSHWASQNIMIQNHKKVDKSKELNKIKPSRESYRVCKTGSFEPHTSKTNINTIWQNH